MLALGLQSKREITRTRIRVRTAMATQTREQGRYLGGRPPYGYRLADAGPHPNKAHAAWGTPGASPRAGPGHRASRPVDVRPAGWPGIAPPESPVPSTTPGSPGRPPPTPSGTRIASVRRGRYARSRRSLRTRATRAGRYGTGSAPTTTSSIPPTPGWGIARCSGGTCPPDGSSPPVPPTRRSSAGRLHRRPGRQRPARPSRGGYPPVPARGAAALRAVRAAAGIGLVQTASPPTGAATATPAPPRLIAGGRRTCTSGRTRSCPSWSPWPSCTPAMAMPGAA
jgi:hypothetical protein